MRKSLLIISFLLFTLQSFAQIGFKKKPDELQQFKDTRLVVVLFQDSAYNASIIEAVEKYWTFNGGFSFVYDSAMKAYNKPEFSYLFFSKSKGTKIKAKLGSSEVDFNGLIITGGGKFKKKALEADLIAGAFCSNDIDTSDWRAELKRGVQLLNNYFNTAIEGEDGKSMSNAYIIKNAPANKSLLNNTLGVPLRSLDLKGKEDGAQLWGGEIEELEVEEIQRAILTESNQLIFFYSKDERGCNKVVTSTAGELVYLANDAPEKCKLSAKDLKALNLKRTE
ncbi:MAG: hypothetical protein MUC81_04660 [Bacteroidia bacterium]|jgi:hypothetical protein|nr:hypothetical protein [Bacteroidia bacterium]